MNKAVIFDLDGTLIDSIGGIVTAVNYTRKFYGLPPQASELIESFIGNGARKLMERSITADNTDAVSAEDAFNTFNQYYSEHPFDDTFLYPGVKAGLAQLTADHWTLAVVSNKPQPICEKILWGLGIREFFDENIGSESDFPLKPDPTTLYYIMEKYQIDPDKCFVVGDNYTDLDFAANAGVKSVFCTWGFGRTGDNPATFTADDFAAVIDAISGENR